MLLLLLRINGELFRFNIKNALLLFNTTRAHYTDPQAQGATITMDGECGRHSPWSARGNTTRIDTGR